MVAITPGQAMLTGEFGRGVAWIVWRADGDEVKLKEWAENLLNEYEAGLEG